jgi:hypothetical protein
VAGEDERYLKFVRTLPCSKCGAWPPNQAHHLLVEGMKIKAHDHEAMSLCVLCHEQLHKLSGHFKGWGRAQLNAWQWDQIAKTRARTWLNTDENVF